MAIAMTPNPIRLRPGQDLRLALQEAVGARRCEAGFVLSGIGSLEPTGLRLAGHDAVTWVGGPTELLTLSGTVSARHSHLHAAVACAQGTVLGGHVAPGCVVRTTAEVLLVLLSDWRFEREFDAATGFAELSLHAARYHPRR